MNERLFKEWLGNAIPKYKREFVFNRDSLEMLLRMAYQEGTKEKAKSEDARRRNDEYERKYGEGY